jgi:isocitrate dehydrogenase
MVLPSKCPSTHSDRSPHSLVLNVALRANFWPLCLCSSLSLLCGNPFPHKTPGNFDVIVYRENTEVISISDIEWKQGTEIADKLINYLNTELIPATPEHGKKQIPLDAGTGIKPISKTGSRKIKPAWRSNEVGWLYRNRKIKLLSSTRVTLWNIRKGLSGLGLRISWKWNSGMCA